MSRTRPPRPGELLFTEHSIRAIVSVDDHNAQYVGVWRTAADGVSMDTSSIAWLRSAACRFWP